MEQSTRSDSTAVSNRQGAGSAPKADARREAAAQALLTGRPPSRRGFLAGLSAPGLAAAMPAAAAASSAHPDHELLEADAARRDAETAYYSARARSTAAFDAYEADLGPAPQELVLTAEDRYLATPLCYGTQQLRRMRLAWARADLPGDESPHQIWTASALGVAIIHAPAALGRAGRTPHHIRRWRTLLPIAEAFDKRRTSLEASHRVPELSAATRTADKARIAAETRFARLIASNVEGLAVKVRHLDQCDWMRMGAPWIALLQSAAAVAGVELRRPAFDCARWARELQAAGGSVRYDPACDEAGVSFPVSHRHSHEQREELRRLSQEQREHGAEIQFWLSQGGLA